MSGKESRFSNMLQSGKEFVSEWFLLGKESLSDDLLGLQINSEFIKLLLLSKKNKEYTVEFFTRAPIPPDTVIKEEIKNPTVIANILKDLLQDAKLSTNQVAFSIPRSSAIIKDITVDKRLNADEIESRVWIEANRFFPNLVGDIYLDFVVLGPSERDSSQLEIILVACRKEQIDPFLEIVQQADLVSKIVDVNSYALERAIDLIAQQSTDASTIALLNISFSLITLIVIHEGTLVYTHELSYDGRSLLPQSVDELFKSNKTASLNDFPALKANLSLHLRHSMQFFYSSRPNVRINSLIISGDAVVFTPDLAQFIQQETNKETILANPLKNMKFAKGVDRDALNQSSPSLMLCCGLAMSKIL